MELSNNMEQSNNYIVCHYAEIALKGRNRLFFENKLRENIKKSLGPQTFEWVRLFRGRIIIKVLLKTTAQQKEIEKSLKRVFGIANFSFAKQAPLDLEIIKETALELIEIKKGKTFRIEASRDNKAFALNSQKINETVGEFIIEKTDKKVKLENPSITCFIEILQDNAYLYTKKIDGPGGMPVSSAGKVVSLISGGIDSPVASYLMMKRGANCVFVSFHSYPYTDEQSLKKIEEIVKILNQFQFSSTLYLVPFADIQKEIMLKAPEQFRIILYRRMMIRISQEIAKLENAQALITGESLAQVASQTLENMSVIDEVANVPVFRPLIGMDKEEIINIAKNIGTFKTSILPHQDCCVRFMPNNPATRASLRDIKEAEKNLDIQKMIKIAITVKEIKTF